MRALVAAVVLVGIASVAGAICVAALTAEETVAANPYESAARFDRDRHLREALGWEVSVPERGLHPGECALVVAVAGRDGAPLGGAAVAVTVGRAGPEGRDRSYAAIADGAGRYVTAVRFPAFGFWDLRIAVERGDDAVTLEKRIYVARGSQVEP